MNAKVDRQLCGGTGLCAEICPSVFAQDPDYVAYVKEDGERIDAEAGAVVPTALEAAVREAVESCPTGAVAIVEP